jgi:aspartyl-tRNA(Asn)/glutamyl-tRNA(Gln) amidotransferase subunit B
MEKLRQTFLTLGISDCSLESGSMRCDGNVSLRRRGDRKLGTKTELKNINSFKSLHDGLEYEIQRQAEVLEEGGIVYQETRHWEPSRRRTIVMRVKETADDYRLFPDPDLAPFDLTDDFIKECKDRIPELPDAKCERYINDLGLKRSDAVQISGDPLWADFFEHTVAIAGKKMAAQVGKVVCNDLAGWLRAHSVSLSDEPVSPDQLAGLVALLSSDQVSSAKAAEVLDLMAASGKTADAVVDESGMRQVSDTAALEPIVEDVLSRCTDQVAQYKAGSKKVLGYLVGQCMKASRGKGNPKLFNQLLRSRLE